MEDKNVLLDIFKNDHLSDQELKTVINAFDKVIFKKNEFLLKEGQIAVEYYFINSGFIRSFAVDMEGNEITTGFYSQAKIVLEVSSFFLRTPSKEYIQTLTDCVCWRIGFDKFQELFHGIQSFREAGRTRLVEGYFNLKQRSISMITDSAKERYLQLIKDNPEIVHQAPLKHIATYLGITDTSLSRIRKEISNS